MKRFEDYETRFARLSTRMEKVMIRMIVGLFLFFMIGQCVIHFLPVHIWLNETVRWEGSAHILQK